MKKSFWKVILIVLFVSATLAQEIPKELRGGIEADNETIQKALEMNKQGWVYVMPQPKSAKAAWGNHDGRTTWYNGYWKNEKTNDTSSTEPVLKDGKYIGDGSGSKGWSKGGSPAPPSKIEWLLSKSGGIKPR